MARLVYSSFRKLRDGGSQATYKFRCKAGTSSEFAALLTADVVTSQDRATSAPEYPIVSAPNPPDQNHF